MRLGFLLMAKMASKWKENGKYAEEGNNEV